MRGEKINIINSYPHSKGFFAQGVKELVCKLNSVGYRGNLIFVEFEAKNIDFILLSEFKVLVKQHKKSKIILISSEKLLPLSHLYMRLFYSNVITFRVRDPLLYIINKLSQPQAATPVTYPHARVLSVKEAMIMEHSLKGVSVYRISKLFGLNVKTIYHWRKNAENKLGVRKMLDLKGMSFIH